MRWSWRHATCAAWPIGLKKLLLNAGLRNGLSDRGLETVTRYALTRVAPLFGER
jgi:hypothetical protein